MQKQKLQNKTHLRRRKVLEIGCGPGFLSIIMSRLGYDVKAIDGSEDIAWK